MNLNGTRSIGILDLETVSAWFSHPRLVLYLDKSLNFEKLLPADTQENLNKLLGTRPLDKRHGSKGFEMS